MNFFQNIPYKQCTLVKDGLVFKNQKQQISLTRCYCDADIYDRYYLRAKIVTKDYSVHDLGYLYFNIDSKTNKSKFIGVCVSEEYRNCGLASLLISSWIELCLDNGLEDLSTIPKQKKPFILYLLKKYSFELKDTNTYNTSDNVVYICKKENAHDKFIMFRSPYKEANFRNSNIMKTDNYKIADPNDKDIQILDTVSLYSPYFQQDNEYAYQKSLGIINKYR